MGTFTSIVEQVWTLLQGNLMFLLETILGFFRYLFIHINSYLSSCADPDTLLQSFGSGLDPDSIGSLDPDPYSESGSGSRRAKMTHKSRKNKKFHVLKCGMFSFER